MYLCKRTKKFRALNSKRVFQVDFSNVEVKSDSAIVTSQNGVKVGHFLRTGIFSFYVPY